MNPDGREGLPPEAPGSRRGGAWMGGSALIVLMYFMSPVFVAKALIGSGVASSVTIGRFFAVVYAPAKMLYDHWKPYRRLMEAEGKWLKL